MDEEEGQLIGIGARILLRREIAALFSPLPDLADDVKGGRAEDELLESEAARVG